MRWPVAVVLVLAIFSTVARAAAPDTASVVPEGDNTGWVFIPAVYYTPETELAAGVVFMYWHRRPGAPPTSRPTTITPIFIYTQRDQIISSLGGHLYLKDERYWLSGEIGFTRYPDKFWGIGPDTPDAAEEDYTPRTFSVRVALRRRMGHAVHLGIQYSFASEEIIETEPGSLLSLGIIPGSAGGETGGLGALLYWDTRDNTFYPSRGSFHQFTWTRFDAAFGSDFDFDVFFADLRKYIGLGQRHVIALQGLYRGVSGVPPFRLFSTFGGSNLVRGYFGGRYRDKSVLVAQAEYRVKAFWRFGAAAFASTGNVAPSADAFRADTWRTTAGFGVRYFFSEREGITVRMDVGFGGDSLGPYIMLNEAF